MRTWTFGLSIFALCVGLCLGCGGSELATPRSTLFDARALAAVLEKDRAYVAGHALGVYLYSRTLPGWVAGHGYEYQPGASAKQVGYNYRALVTGQIDPAGMPDSFPGDECYRSGHDVVCPSSDPMEPADPSMNEDDDPSGRVDDDCESFLDPAAMQARAMALRLDRESVIDDRVALADRAGIENGLSDALALEDRNEDTRASEPQHLKKVVRGEGLCSHSPLVLDLDGDGIELGDARDGVLFDLRETGKPLRTAWPGKRDALLVIDRDGDGAITDGGELFGTALKEDGSRYEDGFEMLSTLDQNDDGVINAKDPLAAKLWLWMDANRNGVSETGELVSLASEGIVSLSLRYERRLKFDRDGNMLPLWGEFVRVSKDAVRMHGTMVDAWFRIRAAEGAPEI